MRILHVSWEYPPVVYGGLGRHVHSLAREQAAQGHDVSILTQRPPGTSPQEASEGVQIFRVTPPLPEVPRDPVGLVDWVRGLDTSMAQAVTSVIEAATPEVIHAHDWVVTNTAKAARAATGLPLVSTIHATEAGRHQGWVTGPISTHIHQLEYELTNLSQRIITCSTAMRSDVTALFDVSGEGVDVIGNGIDLGSWTVADEDVEAARQSWAPTGQLGVFVGRLEWEKGVHTLLEAMHMLATTDLHLVIAGTGTFEPELVKLADHLLEAERVTFTGWLPEDQLKALQAAADVIVVPSLYEPFGLVALEAGALGVPAVVAATGGLTEIVDNGKAGYLFEAGDAKSLTHAIDHALGDRAETAHRLEAMKHRIETQYQWGQIARQTATTYERALAEQRRWGPQALDIAAPAIFERNLLTRPS